jgi:cell division septum initiation protein DivIVA
MANNPIDTAARELERLQGARARLENELLTDQAAFEKLRGGLAEAECDALLNGGDAAPVRRQIAEFEARIAAHQAVRPALLAKIRQAIKAHASARAEAIRKDAAKLEAQIATHEAETACLREALEKHSGARWFIEVPPMLPGAFPGPFIVSRPRVSVMRGELARLQGQADALIAAAEHRTQQGGQIEATDLDGLLSVCADMESLAPTQSAISAWFLEAKAKADAEWRQKLRSYRNCRAPRRVDVVYTLVWDSDGGIDRGRSTFQNRSVLDGGDYQPAADPAAA